MTDTSLLKEIEDLQLQREHLEQAIACLEKPETAPLRDNPLAEVLLQRLQQSDNVEKRERSVQVSKTLLKEVTDKLQAREAKLKQVRDRLSPARNAMQEQARQINFKAQELSEMLAKFRQSGAYIRSDWQVSQPGCEPIEEAAAIVLPHIYQKPGTNTFVIDQLEIINSNEQSASTNPA